MQDQVFVFLEIQCRYDDFWLRSESRHSEHVAALQVLPHSIAAYVHDETCHVAGSPHS